MKNLPIQFAQGVDPLPGENTLIPDIVNILNAIIAVLGIVAVVVVIIGGINYMTSSGDANKVKKAKDTILYGLIGLIICALAFALVNFVITNVLSGTSGGGSDATTQTTTPDTP